ncbi:MAG: LysM peptidoglycan-binding domain-containing protein [Caldilineaceae bacterium]
MKENPNVAVIDTTGLRLDIPATYTVVAGDSLWIISNKIYGDSTYMDDIFLLNRDILPSPEVLVVGSELKLPPLREEE